MCVLLSFRMPAFRGLQKKIDEMPEFGAWLQQGTPEQAVPRLWQEEKPLTTVQTAMHQLLVIQVANRSHTRVFHVLEKSQNHALLVPCFRPIFTHIKNIRNMHWQSMAFV